MTRFFAFLTLDKAHFGAGYRLTCARKDRSSIKLRNWFTALAARCAVPGHIGRISPVGVGSNSDGQRLRISTLDVVWSLWYFVSQPTLHKDEAGTKQENIFVTCGDCAYAIDMRDMISPGSDATRPWCLQDHRHRLGRLLCRRIKVPKVSQAHALEMDCFQTFDIETLSFSWHEISWVEWLCTCAIW